MISTKSKMLGSRNFASWLAGSPYEVLSFITKCKGSPHLIRPWSICWLRIPLLHQHGNRNSNDNMTASLSSSTLILLEHACLAAPPVCLKLEYWFLNSWGLVERLAASIICATRHFGQPVFLLLLAHGANATRRDGSHDELYNLLVGDMSNGQWLVTIGHGQELV